MSEMKQTNKQTKLIKSFNYKRSPVKFLTRFTGIINKYMTINQFITYFIWDL